MSCALGGAVCGGCDSEANWVPGDEDNIRMVIADISDARSNPEKLASIFSDGSVPDNAWLKKSAKWSFVVESIEISDETANVEIAVENFFGDVLSTQAWTCVKVNDTWRVKDAPLPD